MGIPFVCILLYVINFYKNYAKSERASHYKLLVVLLLPREASEQTVNQKYKRFSGCFLLHSLLYLYNLLIKVYPIISVWLTPLNMMYIPWNEISLIVEFDVQFLCIL